MDRIKDRANKFNIPAKSRKQFKNASLTDS